MRFRRSGKCKALNDWSDSGSQTFLNSFIVAPSLALFYGVKLLFSRHPVSERAARILSIVSSCTFGVYLFEKTWREAGGGAYRALAPIIGEFPASLVHILCACLIGLAATMVWKMVSGAVMKRVKTRMRQEIGE